LAKNNDFQESQEKLVESLFYDTDMQTVVKQWQTLSVELRQAIVKMVR
jgi:hypothetical protein